jgi:hypothetical protein
MVVGVPRQVMVVVYIDINISMLLEEADGAEDAIVELAGLAAAAAAGQ